jgi:hypothetical protein
LNKYICMFRILLGLTALLIAGCAAFFSVRGIATLFSGAFLSVVIMAGSLELGKLIATTFLHRFWSKTSKLLKSYLLVAVLLLMAITSLGTYGFLSAAFQSNAAKFENNDAKIELIEQQRTSIKEQVEQLQERIKTLNESRIQQQKNLATVTSNATTKYKLVYEDIQRSNQEINNIQTKIDEMQNNISLKEQEVLQLKQHSLEAGDIGAFKFIAENFNMPLNDVVRLFIILLVSVFDPLAVALVLAYSTMVQNKLKDDEQYMNDILNRSVEPTTISEVIIDTDKKIDTSDTQNNFFTVGDTLKFKSKQ